MAGPDAATSTRGTDRRGVDAGSRATEGRARDAAGGDRPVQQGPPIGFWAFHVGDYRKHPESGWTHAVGVTSLREVLAELRDAELQRKVSKLAIVAHGNIGGVVLLEPEMTHENVHSFAKELSQLGEYLTPDGKLMFMSCVAGAGKEGTQLLTAISSYLPGRSIIGFIINGSVRARGFGGDVFESRQGMTGMNPAPFKNEPRMTEESQYAKWVRDQRLVRVPQIDELAFFKGRWRVAMATAGGKSAARLEGATAEVTIDSLELTKGGKRVWLATHQLDIFKRPRTIDLTFTGGKEKGKKALGILRFGEEDFDSLTICLAEPGGKRPDDFTSPPNSRRTLLELRRAPAAKK